MLELEGLHDLAWLQDEAAHTDKGSVFTAFVEASVRQFIPYCRSRYTYSGCSKYISGLRRFCRRPVGKRKGLFQDDELQVMHDGVCEKPGREYYQFRLQLGDDTGSIEAAVGEVAAYIIGNGQPLFGSEFSRLCRVERENHLRARIDRRFFFKLQYSRPWEGPGRWKVIEVSLLPLHTFRTPSPCSTRSSGQSAASHSSDMVLAEALPDGSPNRRLLGMRGGRATPPAVLPEDGVTRRRLKLISALDGLQRTSQAMKLSLLLVDATIEDLSNFLDATS